MTEEKKSVDKIADAVYVVGSAYAGLYIVAFVLFILFVAYVLIMPEPEHGNPPVEVRTPGGYTQTREITSDEFKTYWNVFINQANSNGYPGNRWYNGKWIGEEDFRLCQRLWLQFLSQRGLRQPRTN